jgi:hypothetical protein
MPLPSSLTGGNRWAKFKNVLGCRSRGSFGILKVIVLIIFNESFYTQQVG